MSYKEEPIKERRDKGPMGGTWEEHPAFGVVSLSRISGGGGVMFGSVVNHSGYIALRIRRCQRQHDYGQDTLFAKEHLIEVGMTEAQFAELITTWNQGEGCPCTLKQIGSETVPNIPAEQEQSQSDRAKKDFEMTAGEYLGKFREARKQADEILDKKSINKGDRERLRWIMDGMGRLFTDAAPFAVEQFVGLAERQVARAKTEIDAFVTNVIRKTGLEALKGTKLIGDGEEDKDAS